MRIYQLTWQGDFRLTSRTDVRARRGRGLSIFMLALALFFGGTYLADLLGWTPAEGSIEPEVERALILMAAGLVFLAVWNLSGAHDVTLKGKTLRIRRRGLFGSRVDELTAEAFQGVAHETLRCQKLGWNWSPHFGIYPTISDVTLQRLLLVHPQHSWQVLLRQDLDDEVPRKEWEGYAKRFDLPLLIGDGEQLHERQPENLDKTLRQLAEEGRLAGPATAGPPPWSLSLTSAPDRIVITVRRPAVGWRWFTAAAALPPALLIGGIANGPSTIWSTTGPLIVLFMAVVAYLALARPQIIVTRERIGRYLMLPFLQARLRDDLALGDIEQINVRKISGDRHRSLLLSGDAGSLVLGRGLPASHLEWLRDYLTGAIITA